VELHDANRTIARLKEELQVKQAEAFDFQMSLSAEAAEQTALRDEIRRLQGELALKSHDDRLVARSVS
jgi:predicted nuclease with TOPRIM domain